LTKIKNEKLKIKNSIGNQSEGGDLHAFFSLFGNPFKNQKEAP